MRFANKEFGEGEPKSDEKEERREKKIMKFVCVLRGEKQIRIGSKW